MNDETPKRGYDMAAIAQLVATRVRELLNDVELRKWCVEKAIEAGAGQPLMMPTEANVQATITFGVVPTADSIYNFATAGLTDAAPRDETASRT